VSKALTFSSHFNLKKLNLDAVGSIDRRQVVDEEEFLEKLGMDEKIKKKF
jgi:hypothetical protein